MENIQFHWQHHTTPRQYYEIIEGYPYSGEEDMEISDDEDDLPPLENLAPPVLQHGAFVLPALITDPPYYRYNKYKKLVYL